MPGHYIAVERCAWLRRAGRRAVQADIRGPREFIGVDVAIEPDASHAQRDRRCQIWRRRGRLGAARQRQQQDASERVRRSSQPKTTSIPITAAAVRQWVSDPHPVDPLSNHDLGMLAVANVAAEHSDGTSSAPPRRHAKSGLSWLAAIPRAACCAGLPSAARLQVIAACRTWVIAARCAKDAPPRGAGQG
jgi:hypothetical protein